MKGIRIILVCISFCCLLLITTQVIAQNNKPQVKKIIPKSVNFEYNLVFFDKNSYVLRTVKKNIQVPSNITKEQKIKVIIEDLLSTPEEILSQQGLRKVIQPKISVVDVKCSTPTYKTLDGTEVKHHAVMIEFSRDIIPLLDDATLEDFVTQIRFTFETSGIECTQLDLKARDKKGILRNLIYFTDHKEE